MAKKGLEYFSFDVDFFDNDKVALIEAEFGMKGVFVLIKLLCKIYSEGYYCEWGDDQCLLFTARKLKPSMPDIDAKYTQKVVNALLKRDFFNQDMYNEYSVLTSKSIQERYYEVAKRRQKADFYTPFWLLNESKNVSRNEENVSRNEENVSRNSQRKGKESKVKESKYNNHHQDAHARGGGRNLYEELCKAVAFRDDVYDATAITSGWQNHYCEYYMQWLALTKEQQQAFPLNLHNQTLCARDNLAPDYDKWHALCWVKDNTLHAEYLEIYALSTNDKALFELRRLIKECKKGKITMPGKFIIKHLKAL